MRAAPSCILTRIITQVERVSMARVFIVVFIGISLSSPSGNAVFAASPHSFSTRPFDFDEKIPLSTLCSITSISCEMPEKVFIASQEISATSKQHSCDMQFNAVAVALKS